MSTVDPNIKLFNPTVASHGYSSAGIFILGGYPLKDDLAKGLALSGTTESTLNAFLHTYGMNIKQCYRSTFIKEQLEYLGTNVKRQQQAISNIDLDKYENLLFEELLEVQPTVIVPLDDLSLGAVFPHIHTMKKPARRKYWMQCYRGSVLPLREDWQVKLPPIKIIPTYSPFLLNIEWAARHYVTLDYAKIVKYKDSRSDVREVGLCWVAKNAEQFQLFLDRQLSKKPVRLTFDVETYGGMLTCISFCFDGNESCTVPLIDAKISLGERVLLWSLVAKLLAYPIEKNNQNIKYDWTILERHGFNVTNVRSDTMLKTALIYPELAKGLDFLTSIYTDIPYYKDEGKEFNPRLHSRDRLYIYCAKDSLAAHQISVKQDEELIETNQKELYDNNIAPLIQIYKDIDNTGILVDDAQKKKLIFKYANIYEVNLQILRGLVNNQKFNPRSPKQVGDLIYEELKYPSRTKTDPETGAKSWLTSKETLDDLLINHAEANKLGKMGYAIISRIIMCRKVSKVKEYIETMLHPDGRFHGVSNLAGTESGRSSFSKTIDEAFDDNSECKRLGRSLQTISKHGFRIDEEIFDDIEDTEIASDMRSMFVPDRGYLFIEGDGSQAESRVVAVLAEDYELLASFDQKPKIHAKTAAFIYGLDPLTITKDAPQVPIIGMAYYDVGKRAMHAGSYDMHGGRLSQMTHIPIRECNRIMTKFHERYPKIREVFHAEVRNEIRQRRSLRTPYKRKRDFFGRLNDDMYKEGFSYIPQSTVSDYTKFILPELHDLIPEARILTEQHDGILGLVPVDLKNKYLETFKKLYERPLSFIECTLSRDFNLTIPCELSVSETNWQELKEVKI